MGSWSGIQGQTLSPSGYLGGINLPIARSLESGSAWFSVANNNPEFSDPYGRGAFGSASLGLGLLPGVEVVGRLSFAGDPHCSLYVRNCQAGPRDLSVSGKLSLPLAGLRKTWVAVGVTDYGGAATRYRGQYVVATHDLGVVDVSVGYGRAESPGALVDGAFASAQVRLTPHWSSVMETSRTQGHRFGVLNQHRLLEHWSGHLAISAGFDQPGGRQAGQLGLGLQWSPSSGSSESRRTEQLHSPPIDPLLLRIPLAMAIDQMGFQLIRHESDSLAVDLHRHRSSRVSALRQLLRLFSEHPSTRGRAWRIDLFLWGRPVQSFRASADCLQAASSGSISCAEPLEHPPRIHAMFLPSWESIKPQFEIGLGLRSTVGTEYGLFDYSAAAEIGWESRVLPGLVWQGFFSVPLSRTDDFAPERVFAAERHWRSQIEQSLASYWWTLPAHSFNLQLQASAGQMSPGWDGQQLDALWLSPSGRWRVFVSLGRYEHADGVKGDADQAITSLRYSVWPGRWHLDVQGGRYFGDDRGLRLTSVHWAGPLRASLFFLRSGNPSRWDLPRRSFAGFEISFPLDLFSAGWSGVSIRGRDRWTYRLETKVGEEDNLITRGYGRVQTPRHGLLTSITDFDRAGMADTRARLVQSTALH